MHDDTTWDLLVEHHVRWLVRDLRVRWALEERASHTD
jgi:hypothetical protein